MTLPLAGARVTAADLLAIFPLNTDAWTTFTPAWTSTGTAPAIGNGTLTGRYTKIGRTIHYEIAFIPGTTTTYGTGTYRWSLPEAAASSGRAVGEGFVRDATDGLPRFRGARTVSTTTVELWDAAGAAVAQTVPFTWATSDQAFIGGTYEAAS